MTAKIELKLASAPEYAERLWHHPVVREYRQRRAVTKHIFSTYYDTPTSALSGNKIELRIVRVGRRRVQTIRRNLLPGKMVGSFGVWEHPIESDNPDFSRLNDPELRALLEPLRADGELKPAFMTEMTRRVWPLKIDDTEIVYALDIGEICANGIHHPLCEVALELKAGERFKLFELARQLCRTVPLRIERATKAERGYCLVAGAQPKPVFAKQVRLHTNMTVRAAFCRIVRACIEHVVANVDCAHHGSDPEGVHQLRVGIRRLRAALSVFRDVIPEQDWFSISAELRWFQQELGPAREWDVLLKETFAAVEKHVEFAQDMRRLQAIAGAHRTAAYERTRNALGDPRYTDLLLRLEGWIEGPIGSGAPPPAGQGTATPHQPPVAETVEMSLPGSANENVAAVESEPYPLDRPIATFAVEVLGVRHAKVRKLGHKIRNLSSEQIHRLRIRVKKLRYAAEFFRDLAPKKAGKRYASALKNLQNALGVAQDAAVAHRLVRTLAAEADPKIEREAGLLEGWIAANLLHDRKRLNGFWRNFCENKPFWIVE